MSGYAQRPDVFDTVLFDLHPVFKSAYRSPYWDGEKGEWRDVNAEEACALAEKLCGFPTAIKNRRQLCLQAAATLCLFAMTEPVA